MMRRGQTCNGASKRMLLSSKTVLNIGQWNVRTMYEAGRAGVIAREMTNYGLAILGVSETHWTLSGETHLQDGITVLYSGRTEENAVHSEGVGFFLTKKSYRSLIEWSPVSSRIIRAIFRTSNKRINLVIIQCYAPTNDAEVT